MHERPRLDESQIARATRVFEILAEPSDQFFLETRPEHTQQNSGTQRRSPGISTMMPYQHFYHRLGGTTHDSYPSHMDASATIGTTYDPEAALLSYFPDSPGGPKLSENIFSNIPEEILASYERFTLRISQDWLNYQLKDHLNDLVRKITGGRDIIPDVVGQTPWGVNIWEFISEGQRHTIIPIRRTSMETDYFEGSRIGAERTFMGAGIDHFPIYYPSKIKPD